MSVTMVELAQIIHVHHGAALRQSDRAGAGQYEVFDSSGIVGHHDEPLFTHPSIVIGRKGSVGTITYAPRGGWAIDTTFYIERIGPQACDLRYLFHALSTCNWARHTITTSIPGLSREDIYRTRIPLPPLLEQRRVANILDKADAIRHKRKQAIALTEELLHSAFLEMFGPAARDYTTWQERTLEQLAAATPHAMRTGPFGGDLSHSELVEDGVAVLGIDNAVRNRFRWDERRFITAQKYEPLRRYTVLPNDVIVTIMGTTGRSAVIPDDIPTAITTKHLATITLDRSKAEPEFISQALFRHPSVLRQIRAATRGAIMGGLDLDLDIIKSLHLPVPPIARQREFTRITRDIRLLEHRLETALVSSDHLFHSLVQRAFSDPLP